MRFKLFSAGFLLAVISRQLCIKIPNSSFRNICKPNKGKVFFLKSLM